MKKSEHSRIGGIGKIWPIFGIRKDERWLAMVSVLIFSFLNFMTVNMDSIAGTITEIITNSAGESKKTWNPIDRVKTMIAW